MNKQVTLGVKYDDGGANQQLQALAGNVNTVGFSLESLQNTSARLAQTNGAQSQALEALADSLEESTDGYDRLRGAVDATGDTLRLFGKEASALADEVEDSVSDPAKRAALNLKLLERQKQLNRRALTRLKDEYNVARVQLVQFAGGVKVANALTKVSTGLFLGFAAAVGGVAVKALATYAEQDRKTAQAQENLNKAVNEFFFALGHAVAGGDDLADTLDALTGFFNKLRGEVEENRDELNDFFRDAVKGFTYLVEWAGKLVLGVALVPVAVFESVEYAFNAFVEFVAEATLETVRALNHLGVVSDQKVASVQHNYNNLLRSLARDQEFAVTKRLAELVDQLGAGADKAREFLDSLGGDGVGGPSSKRSRVSKGKEQKGEEWVFGSEAALVVGGEKELLDAFVKTGLETGEAFYGAFLGAGEAFVEKVQKTVGTVTDWTSERLKGERVDRYAQAWERAGEVFKNVSLDAVFLFGTLASGNVTLESFGSGVLQLLSTLAQRTAPILITLGEGLFAAQTGNALGLIAAGVALTFLAGTLSGLASPKPQRADRGQLRDLERVGDRLAQGVDTPTRQTRPQVLVIGDKAFSGYLYDELNQARRRGYLRGA